MSEKSYRILGFHAENIKRLSVVDIKPDGNMVEITGGNGNGKTSVLDAIWWAIEGAKAIQRDPINKDSAKAIIKLDLGDLKITRRFTRQDPEEFGASFTTSIVVENAEGFRPQKPQSMLDALFGALSFDPLEFKGMKAAAQFDMLRQFVPGVDFAALDKEDAKDYEARTDVNRTAKSMRAQADGIVIEEVEGEPVDEEALAEELSDAHEANARLEKEHEKRKAMEQAAKMERVAAGEFAKQADNLQKRIVEMQEQLDLHLETGQAKQRRATEIEQALAGAPKIPDPIDVSSIREKMAQARSLNASLNGVERNRNDKARLEASAEKAEADSDALTKNMEERKAKKQKAIAEAKMPIDGLSFGDGIVTLDGVPFEQGSDAEQLRASVAIAMALNPRLKVIRIRDGSLLDDNSWKMLADMAEERGYQCWVEVVKSDRPGAIVIEDGRVLEDADAKPKGAML